MKTQFAERHARVHLEMVRLELDVLVVSDPIDLRYLTGLILSCGQLWISRQGAVLHVDDRYLERAKTAFSSARGSLQARSDWLRSRMGPDGLSVGFDSARVSVETFDAWATELVAGFGPSLRWVKAPSVVQRVRAVKDEGEIASITRAAVLGARGFDFLLTRLCDGATERELVRALKLFWLDAGGEGVAFEPTIAFGENASRPHHESGERALRKGDLVLIDIGVRLSGYCSDFTRTFFFAKSEKGLDVELVRAWHCATRALDAASAVCRAGYEVKRVDAAARAVMKKEGLEERFTHGLGHGVGLEVHEAPRIHKECTASLALQAGNVITLEPGLYFEGRGGVRQEDLFLVEEGGCRPLVLRPRALLLGNF